MIMIFSLNCMSVFAAEQEEVNEGCVEISLNQAQPYASNYYSKSLAYNNY